MLQVCCRCVGLLQAALAEGFLQAAWRGKVSRKRTKVLSKAKKVQVLRQMVVNRNSSRLWMRKVFDRTAIESRKKVSVHWLSGV